jgi:AraC-like DNA-binding protein
MTDLQIQTTALQGYEQLVAKLGGNARAILQAHGMNSLLTEHGQSFSVLDFVELLEHTANVLNCPSFGMQLGAKQNFFALGVIGHRLAACRTLRQALNVCQSYINYHNQAEFWLVRQFESHTYLCRYDMAPYKTDPRQFVELAFAITLNLIRLSLPKLEKSIRITFSHKPLATLNEYRQVFSVPIAFNNDVDALVMPTRYLDMELDKSKTSAFLSSFNLKVLDIKKKTNVKQEVIKLVQQTLLYQSPKLAEVADMMQLSERQLQRKLQKEGLNYNQLLTTIKMQVAKRFLTYSTLSVTQIAAILGYVELGNFSRAFTKYFNISPQKWRSSENEQFLNE